MDRSPSAADAAPADNAAPAEPEMPPVPGLRLRVFPALTVLLLTWTLFVLAGNFLPTRAANAATATQLEEQHRENREFSERIRVAEAKAEALRTDPWLTERILRDELHQSKPGEILIR